MIFSNTISSVSCLPTLDCANEFPDGWVAAAHCTCELAVPPFHFLICSVLYKKRPHVHVPQGKRELRSAALPVLANAADIILLEVVQNWFHLLQIEADTKA